MTLQSRAVSSGAAPADQNPAGTVLLPPGGSVSYGLQLSLPYQPGTGPILAATGTLSYTGGAMPALVAPLASGAQFRFEHDVAAPGSVEVAGVGGAQLPTTGLGQIPVTGTGQIPAPSTGAASISGRYVLESGAPLKKVDVVLKQVDVSPNVEIAKVTTGDDGLFSFAVPALGHVYGLEAQPPQNIYPDVGAIPGVAGRYVDVYNLHVYTQPDITSYSGYVFVAAKIR